MTDSVLQSIAAQYGTPAFVFDTDVLAHRVQAVREALGSGIRLCYAMKANPFLVPAMAQLADALEVCSPGELSICETVRAPMQKVIFSGVHKAQQDIAAAVQNGVGEYTAESPLHVQLLQQEAARAGKTLPVLLRLTSGSQFGMDEAELRALVANRAAYPALEFVGIHYFVGTQRKKTAEHKAELARLDALCTALQEEYGFACRRVEYGPGLWVPYFTCDDFTNPLAPLLEIAPALRQLAQHVQLTVEMGRFFTAPCGWYLTRVADIKQNCGTHYAIVDGGVNHVNYFGQMMGMKLPHLRQFSAAAPEIENVPVTLCGSLCTTADILVRSMPFAGLAKGDLLALENLGAYSVTEGIYLFLSRAMPRIVLYSEQTGPRLVREAFATHILNTIGE